MFKKYALSRRALKPYLAEFFGTALLIVIGDGVVAQALLSDYQYGTWLSINIAWAAAVALSGFFSDPSPTINPAVTICMALVRPTPGQWKKLPGKLLAQFLGGFVGAALVYANYRSAIADWDPEFTIPGGSILSPRGHHSAGIFSTYPAAFFGSNWEAAFNECLAAAVLMFGVLSISDPVNGVRFASPQVSMFLLLVAIGAALGWQTGYVGVPRGTNCEGDADCHRLSTRRETLVPGCFRRLSMDERFSLRLTIILSCPSLPRWSGALSALRSTILCSTRETTRGLLVL